MTKRGVGTSASQGEEGAGRDRGGAEPAPDLVEGRLEPRQAQVLGLEEIELGPRRGQVGKLEPDPPDPHAPFPRPLEGGEGEG